MDSSQCFLMSLKEVPGLDFPDPLNELQALLKFTSLETAGEESAPIPVYSHPCAGATLTPNCALRWAASITPITRLACSGLTINSSPNKRWSATLR